MCIECENALNLEFQNLKKIEKRFENDDKREKETPRSLLEELEENASKNCPHWSDNAKNFFVSLYYFGSKRSLDLMKSFGLNPPSLSTIKRHAKSTLPMYSEFGILPEACLQAKQYYSSIDYNGYFIF